MNAQETWEEEYGIKRLMTGSKPTKSFLRWIKYLRKHGIDITGMRALDLGSGEGKNAIYLAEIGLQVHGIEIASNAVGTAQKTVSNLGLTEQIFIKQGSIGEPFAFADNFFDLIIDVTSSNSLTEAERAIYLSQSARVLKPGGQMFVRALCKDGDRNAKQLLHDCPGYEQDTYIIPEWGQTERVFLESDIRELYGQYFDIKKLEKETHYTTFDGRKYRRNFWVMYLVHKKSL